MNPNLDHEQKEAAFWRRFVLPEEDKDRANHPWDGIGYRWFRSVNVVPIEQYRRRKVAGADGTGEGTATT